MSRSGSERSRAGERGSVLGLGLCVVDHLYRVERLDASEERTCYDARVVSAGGMVTTALAQAARLGCDARLLSRVGDDEAGRFARRSLRALGVNTRALVLSRDHSTRIAVVLVHRRTGERRFLVSPRHQSEQRPPKFDLAPIRSGAVLLVDSHFPSAALRAVRAARACGAAVVGDFNRPTRQVLRLLPYVDHPIVPEEFARDFTPDRVQDTIFRLRDEFGGQPIVTQGARGGLYLKGARVRRFATPRVTAIDTTGAGDVFHGAFAAGLVQGLSMERNLARAGRCGAAVCGRLGGVAALL